MFKEHITALDQPQWKCRSKQEINWLYGLLLPLCMQRNTQVCKETECFSERRYISIYNFIYPFVLWLPTGALWNRDLFPFMLQCCLQTAVELHDRQSSKGLEVQSLNGLIWISQVCRSHGISLQCGTWSISWWNPRWKQRHNLTSESSGQDMHSSSW